MTKEQCTALIERLADKTLKRGSEVKHPNISTPVMFVKSAGRRDYYVDHLANEHLLLREEVQILGHPVFIGAVFKKIMLEYGKKEGDSLYPYHGVVEQHVQLAEKWAYCGYNKSLQSILEESEWERQYCSSCNPYESAVTDMICYCSEKPKQLKSPAKELFSFLETLFPNK